MPAQATLDERIAMAHQEVLSLTIAFRRARDLLSDQTILSFLDQVPEKGGNLWIKFTNWRGKSSERTFVDFIRHIIKSGRKEESLPTLDELVESACGPGSALTPRFAEAREKLGDAMVLRFLLAISDRQKTLWTNFRDWEKDPTNSGSGFSEYISWRLGN